MSAIAEAAVITIHGVDGSTWRVAGRGSGMDGVYLAMSPQGLYDTPARSLWTTSAYRPGAVWNGVRYEPMDLVLPFHVTPGERTWAAVNAAWRKAWSLKEDTVIEVETEIYGSRRIRARLLEQPKTVTDIDPHVAEYVEVILTVRAGDPFYYGEPQVQTFEPAPGQTTFSIRPEVFNLGGTEMWPIWEKEGQGLWTIPDFSPESPERRIVMPPILNTLNYVINTTPGEEQLVSPGQDGAWAVMGLTRFVNPVPEMHAGQLSLLSGSGLSPGQSRLSLITRPRFTQPWGES